MKLRILLCLTLFALAAHSQTKEAQFQKIENLLKKLNGVTMSGMTVTSQVFNEKSAKMEGKADGLKQAVSYAGLSWDDFYFDVSETDQNAALSKLLVRFRKDIEITSVSGKETSKENSGEMVLFVATADAKLLEQFMEELKAYTSRSLNELRTASKGQLISFLTKKLNAAIEWDEAKIKSINECEISFAYADGVETTIPVQKLELHENKDEYYVFCYGETKAKVQVKTKSSSATSKYVEHPIVELDFGDDAEAEELAMQVQYAIGRLAGFCR